MILRLLIASLLFATVCHAAPPQPTDFSYVGQSSLPQKQFGFSCYGLARRCSTDTWFTIGNSGAPPYRLIEFKMAVAGAATIVKDWGPIDPNGTLLPCSPTSRFIKGLWWDEVRRHLKIVYGSFYNATLANDPFIAYLTFEGGTLHVHGPWRTLAQVSTDGKQVVGSERCKGNILEAPDDLQQITGKRFVAFGPYSATSQMMCHGTGLVAVDDPTEDVPVGGMIGGQVLMHWQSKHQPNTARPNPTDNGLYYSDFPRLAGDIAVRIDGNMDVTATPLKTSYQQNYLFPFIDSTTGNNRWNRGDAMEGVCFIDNGRVQGWVYVGSCQVGYSWYGNEDSHNDTSADGATWANNVTSLLDPTKKVRDPEAGLHTRGEHAEQRLRRIFVLDHDAAKAAATNGTLQVPYAWGADLSTLGGTVPFNANVKPIHSQPVWVGSESRLYVPVPSDNTIQVWEIN